MIISIVIPYAVYYDLFAAGMVMGFLMLGTADICYRIYTTQKQITFSHNSKTLLESMLKLDESKLKLEEIRIHLEIDKIHLAMEKLRLQRTPNVDKEAGGSGIKDSVTSIKEPIDVTSPPVGGSNADELQSMSFLDNINELTELGKYILELIFGS